MKQFPERLMFAKVAVGLATRSRRADALPRPPASAAHCPARAPLDRRLWHRAAPAARRSTLRMTADDSADDDSEQKRSSPSSPSSSWAPTSSNSPAAASLRDGLIDEDGFDWSGDIFEGDIGYDPKTDPMRYQFTEAELQEQQRAMTALSNKWRAERLAREARERRWFGFCPRAELLNARVAMFFFAVGMFTEYVTGQSMPQQIEYFLRILGIIE